MSIGFTPRQQRDGAEPNYRFPHTTGAFETEPAAEKAIDVFLDAAAANGYWHVFRQRELYPVAEPAHRVPTKHSYRADRLLVITSKMPAIGWTRGDIVIEVKRSGLTIGRPFCQLMDYKQSKAISSSGRIIMPGCGFLFPCGKLEGPLGSVSEQFLVGTASMSPDAEVLWFQFGNQHAMTLTKGGEVHVGLKGSGESGNGSGNRG